MKEEISRREKEVLSGAKPNHVENPGQSNNQIGSQDEHYQGNVQQTPATVTQKQRHAIQQQMGTSEAAARSNTSESLIVPHPLELSAQELIRLQKTDDTLAQVREAVSNDSNFFNQGGLLYRKWRPPGRGEESEIEQLILPKTCQRKVLELGHEIPLAGHLGVTKSRQRVLRRFYWPTVFKDIEEFCKCCRECQKSNAHKTPPAPLIPLPIITEPFRRIAMDIVGPLPPSRSGNRFVLVICDYATRYPEAIPLRSTDAPHIAEELIRMFARVGVPQEILTDQGSNFTSQLLAELYRLLHVHPIRTSHYHPQTDGLVERFNQTLKSMLRKAATNEGKDWDKLVPYLLFAYREVPQASTGFSPLELLYGRDVWGPLDILKESWEASHKSDESIGSYVLSTREKLLNMSELVQENLSKSQSRQKTWCDKKARAREFQPGYPVLVLLPTSTSKLLAQWQGPYQITRHMGKATYMVDMHDHRKRLRVFHVNMLKEFQVHKAVESSYFTEDVEYESDEEEVPFWQDGTPQDRPTISKQLSDEQVLQLQQVLLQFDQVLKNQPGRTVLAEHRIETGTARPVRLPPYRLPHAYRNSVQEEIQEMLKHDIIEPSSSDWAAPIVLVTKKDGGLRLCVDYWRLNAVSTTDTYPMPKIDAMIDQLGKASYISTLDLT